MGLPSIYERSDAELIPKPVLREFQKMGKLVEGRKDMVGLIIDNLRQSMQNGHVMTLFLDGLPGSGKSGMEEKVRKIVVNEGVLPEDQVVTFPLDLFIGTEQGSNERARMTQTPDLFGRHYMRYTEARERLQEVFARMKKPEEGSIQIPRAYLRDEPHNGKFGNFTLNVSPDTKLVIVEGTGSIDNLAGPDGFPAWVDPYLVFMHMTKKQSLFRATLRDIRRGKGGASFEDIYQKRDREYQYLTSRLLPSVRLADKVCVRFPKKDDFRRRLAVTEQEIEAKNAANPDPDQTQKTTRQILSAVDPAFLRNIFPGELPQDYRFV